ncbi:hypothetical protein NRIC_28390 [Enterococcus florum]|uniref:HTH cro/C1-type domain-containing protein n=1 Tax=Enterococcus florum TaxID=2480627 RepID=A0A4P5PFC7_9ENTE|nr:helix-turn-helix domain-containing protein [Enterococcus florum]GCF94948.1 hypothetical protein NRIC_28390 [Enterococcus florum]
MNNLKSNISANLCYLRTANRLTQEELAEKIQVTRQAVAKWENGDSLPDIIKCAALAELFEVSLNDLVSYDPIANGVPIAPKGKHFFGTVTINDRGQIVLPKKARDTMNFKAGDTLVILGDSNPMTGGIALLSSEMFFRITGRDGSYFFKGDQK